VPWVPGWRRGSRVGFRARGAAARMRTRSRGCCPECGRAPAAVALNAEALPPERPELGTAGLRGGLGAKGWGDLSTHLWVCNSPHPSCPARLPGALSPVWVASAGARIRWLGPWARPGRGAAAGRLRRGGRRGVGDGPGGPGSAALGAGDSLPTATCLAPRAPGGAMAGGPPTSAYPLRNAESHPRRGRVHVDRTERWE
jgi:hypothetical protein